MPDSSNAVQLSFTQTKSKPFLKWVGGKSQLLNQFEPYFSAAFTGVNVKRYIEPFVGGGAVFFHLNNRDYLPESAILNDNNEELINTFLIVRDHVEQLISLLSVHENKHNREYVRIPICTNNNLLPLDGGG